MNFNFSSSPSYTHLIPLSFPSVPSIQQNISYDAQHFISLNSDCQTNNSRALLMPFQSSFSNFAQQQTPQSSPGLSISSTSYQPQFQPQQQFLPPLDIINHGYSQLNQQLSFPNINNNNSDLQSISQQVYNILQSQQIIPVQPSQFTCQSNIPSSLISMIFPTTSVSNQSSQQLIMPLQSIDPKQSLSFTNNSQQVPIQSVFTQFNSSNYQIFLQSNDQQCTFNKKEQAQLNKTDQDKQQKQYPCNQFPGDSKSEQTLKKEEIIQLSPQIPIQSTNESNQKVNPTVNQSKLIFKLTDSEKQVLNQLHRINMQNAFKNIIKAFINFINKSFDKVYFYDYQENPKTKQPSILSTVKLIENPSSDQKKMFLQKFNKFMKSKKFNNASIRQIIENRLYSSVLKDYIQNHSQDWVFHSNFRKREDIIAVLQYFSLCCDNKNLLLFLRKVSENYEIN